MILIISLWLMCGITSFCLILLRTGRPELQTRIIGAIIQLILGPIGLVIEFFMALFRD